MAVLRLHDEPWPGGRGVYDHVVGGFRRVVESEGAGEYLERKSTEGRSVRTGGSAERCAMHGGPLLGPKE